MNIKKYKRVLLKISGESLRSENSSDNISPEIVNSIVEQVKKAFALEIEIAIVVGGGNFWRGLSAEQRGMERTTADNIGMLATVMNSLALQWALEKSNVPSRVMSAIKMEGVAEPFIRLRATRHLEKKRVVIFAGGSGNPYFSTDTAAALRANEINADIILKGTNVDGIFDKDPRKHSDAKLFKELTFEKALKENLQVLDSTAFSLCKDNDKKLLVFNMTKKNNIYKALAGEVCGTIVKNNAKEKVS